MAVEPFAAERRVFVVAKSHPYAKKRRITVNEVAKAPLLVGIGRDSGRTTIEVLRRKIKAEINFNVAMQCDSSDALKAAVKSGAGVGILYQDMVTEELKSGALKILTPVGFDLDGQSHLVFLKDRTFSPMMTEFLEFVRAQRKLMTRNGQRPTPRKKPFRDRKAVSLDC